MRDYPTTWTDHLGRQRKVPTVLGRLKFRIPLHAALRAFVFRRDGCRCVTCGAAPDEIPADYDGRKTVPLPSGWCLVMDHVRSRRNGGSHHPDNLCTLCDSCNSAKAGLIDAKGG